jgi:uncharacterized protein (DUF433 family)
MDTLSVPLSEAMAAKLRALPPEEQRGVTESLQEFAEEAIKMREHPDIYFMDGPAGRRARVRDGLDAWEIIQPYYLEGKDQEVLQKTYDWLPGSVLRAALRYYEAYPGEIEAWIIRNNRVD